MCQPPLVLISPHLSAGWRHVYTVHVTTRRAAVKNPDKRRHFVNKEWHFKRSYPVGMCRLIHEAIVYIYDLKKHVGIFSIREDRLALVVLPEFFLLQKSMKKF